MTPRLITGVVWERSGVSLMARIVGQDAQNITQSALVSISFKIFDLAVPEAAKSSGTLTVSSVVFNTLQTDTRWTKDATGYNFRHDVGATAFSGGTKDWRIEYLFTPSGGAAPFWVVFELHAHRIYS